MELRDLSYFLACLDEGHLTRAAQHLHVAQPTLSHAVARLEAEAGEPLLERPRKGRPKLLPTAAGRLLEQRARRALGEVHGFADDLAALRGVTRGHVRIGSMQTLNSTVLPLPLATFAMTHPDVRIQLHTLAAEDIPTALHEGRIDIGLLAGAPISVVTKLATKRLCTEEFVAIVRYGNRLSRRRVIPLKMLSEEKFVFVLPGTFTYAILVEACRKAGFFPDIRLALESGEAIREVVKAGLGVSILPAGYIDRGDDSLKAIRLISPTPAREVLVAYDPRSEPAVAVKAFLASLEAHFAINPKRGKAMGG
jgi:DNA-binding transcriptional LysR family regulator